MSSIVDPPSDGKSDSHPVGGILDALLNGQTEDPQGVTYLDLVRHVLGDPDLDADTCDYILWERTPFPLLRRPDSLRPYLEEVRDEIAARESGDAR